ncbi:NACHT, LRR and PYD domains-containing protein 3-like [Synchiropus picturatus]
MDPSLRFETEHQDSDESETYETASEGNEDGARFKTADQSSDESETYEVTSGENEEGGRKSQRREESAPSSVSLKSNKSMDRFFRFKTADQSSDESETYEVTSGENEDGGRKSQRREVSAPSSVSLKSNKSMDRFFRFKTADQSSDESETYEVTSGENEDGGRFKTADQSSDESETYEVTSRENKDGGRKSQRREESAPSSVSLKSNKSMDRFFRFKTADQCSDESETYEVTSGENEDGGRVSLKTQSLRRHKQPQQPLASTLQLLRRKIISYVDNEVMILQRILEDDDRVGPERQEEAEATKGSREAFRKLSENILQSMNQEQLVQRLWGERRAVTSDVKESLQRKFRHINEGIAKAGVTTLLNDIYTELFIAQGFTDHINKEHEVRQFEAAVRRHTLLGKNIRQQDLLQDHDGRTLLIMGEAGIGKTVLTQKVILDWAEDKAHQNFDLVLPLTFRELNMLKEKKMSLVDLISRFFPETKKANPNSFEELHIVFIFDGLDECRLPLDFHRNRVLKTVTEADSLDVLLTNLIKGNLLPSARLWLTTRPAAANQIPPECVDMVTEVRGFTDKQKVEYFVKRSRDITQANNIISHIKSARSLCNMCHIPIFCWITATVLEHMLDRALTEELPKTLTQMYIHFLVVQAKVMMGKYDGGASTNSHWTRNSKTMIESLGQLAFEQLQEGRLIFYESDLSENDIKVTAAALYSGVFTQIFREESGLYQEKVFSFIHPSVQVFLAALYVHMKFSKYGVNLLLEERPAAFVNVNHGNHEEFYQSALNKALKSPNGHLDMFLRFLLGLSLKSNQRLLRGLSEEIGSSWTGQKSAELIKKKITTTESQGRIMNLFHCLDELKDTSLVEEVQQMIRSGRLSKDPLSSSHWSALIFLLLTSREDQFDLNKYGPSMEAFLNLLPVIQVSNNVLLRSCGLSMNCCEDLSSVLKSPSSKLTELDLSNNDLKDDGMKLLCEGLKSPNCQVETLRLRLCGLSKESCTHLSPVLSPSSCLKNLDLSDNDLKDAGVNLLCAGLKNPDCHLETLGLSGCLVTQTGCASLASALGSNPSHLRELDLSWNHLTGPGLDLLSAGLKNSEWRLETLKLMHNDKQRLTPGLRKYFCQFTLDPDTAHQRLRLTNNNKTAELMREDQKHPYSPRRFTSQPQLICENSLAAHHYWEVEHQGEVVIAVTYRQYSGTEEFEFGQNDWSWSLRCLDGVSYEICHNNTKWSMAFHSVSDRVGVYVDWSAGVVSFYRVTNDTLIHIHTFYTSFTQPLYPAFGLRHQMGCGSSVTLSGLDEHSVS